MMKYIFLFCILLSNTFVYAEGFVHFKERNKIFFSATPIFQSISIETNESDSSEVVNSSFTMAGVNLNLDYFYTSKWVFHFDYYIAMILSIDAEVQGFDLGVKYYIQNGASKHIEFLGNSLQSDTKYSYYAYLNTATKNFQFAAVNLRFQGVDFGAGIDWHLTSDYYLRAEAGIELLFNNNIRNYSALGASLGIGFKY